MEDQSDAFRSLLTSSSEAEYLHICLVMESLSAKYELVTASELRLCCVNRTLLCCNNTCSAPYIESGKSKGLYPCDSNINQGSCDNASECSPHKGKDCNMYIGILGSLLSLALLAIVILIVYFKRKYRNTKKPEDKASITFQKESNVEKLPERGVRLAKPLTIIKNEQHTENDTVNEYDVLPKRHKPPTPPNVRKQNEEMARTEFETKEDSYLDMDSNTKNDIGAYYENFGNEDEVYGNVEQDDIYINN